MIICGNIYLDEIKKTFILKCVICEKKSKAYTEFTKHIKKKHKSLDGTEAPLDNKEDEQKCSLQNLLSEDFIPSPNIVKLEEDVLDTDNEDEKPLLQIKHEMEFVEEGPNETKFAIETVTEVRYKIHTNSHVRFIKFGFDRVNLLWIRWQYWTKMKS